jgi:hypothetical protein
MLINSFMSHLVGHSEAQPLGTTPDAELMPPCMHHRPEPGAANASPPARDHLRAGAIEPPPPRGHADSWLAGWLD